MKIRPRLVWTALAFAVVLGALWQFIPLPDASARLQSLPENAPGVRSQNVELTRAEAQIFARTTVIKRIASVNGHPLMLTVIDGTRNRHAIHDPRFCFQGAGWTVRSSEILPVENGEAACLQLEKDGGAAGAVYWFSDGVRRFDSSFDYWTRTTLRRLTFGRSGEEPVLVILTSLTDRPVDWRRVLQSWSDLQTL